MAPLTFGPDHPARPRQVDLLTADHPYRPLSTRYRWRDAIWLRAIVFMGVAMMVAVALFALGFIGPVARVSESFGYLVVLIELVAAVVGYAVLLRMERRTRPVELDPSRWRGLLGGLALGVVACSVIIGILALTGSYRIVGINPQYSVVPDLISAGFTAAIAEEIAFRGVLFRLIEEQVGTWGAVVGSSVVFGLAHLSNPQATVWGAVAIALEAGLLFAALYAVTRSLWWTIGLHFAWNMMEGPFFGSAVSGSGPADGWLVARFTGPTWWSGGTFGIEGSALTVVLLTAVGIALLAVVARERLAVRPSPVRRRILSSRPVDFGAEPALTPSAAEPVPPLPDPSAQVPTTSPARPDGGAPAQGE